MEGDESGRRLKTLETAIEIIELIKREEGVDLRDVAKNVDIAKSTAHGYLKTLQRHGYLTREDDTYHIGLEFLEKGGYERRRRPGYEFIIDKVDYLAAQTGERAQFIVEENGRGYYVHTSIGENAVHVDARIGKKIPLHASSAGKSILAELPDGEVNRIINRWGLDSMTTETITEREELRHELEQIRADGYAISNQESIEGLRAVGVAIKQDSRPIGGISLSGPAHRMNCERFDDEIIDLVRGVANEIELDLGYR